MDGVKDPTMVSESTRTVTIEMGVLRGADAKVPLVLATLEKLCDFQLTGMDDAVTTTVKPGPALLGWTRRQSIADVAIDSEGIECEPRSEAEPDGRKLGDCLPCIMQTNDESPHRVVRIVVGVYPLSVKLQIQFQKGDFLGDISSRCFPQRLSGMILCQRFPSAEEDLGESRLVAVDQLATVLAEPDSIIDVATLIPCEIRV